MFEIVTKKLIAPDIYYMDVYAPRMAHSALPGQFLIVRVDDKGERVPLTISDYDRDKGTITIVTQALGVSTRKIVALNEGDHFANFAGPLGRPSELIEMSDEELGRKRILFIAGGVGAAPVYPQVKYLNQRGIKPDVILGARSANLLIYRENLEAISNHLYIATNDGTEGMQGLVTDALARIIETEEKPVDLVITIGPMIMMKVVNDFTMQKNIPTIASLNTLMVDGTGMCGACRVSVNGRTKFTCIDGPEFDAHLINWDEAMRRQGMYKSIEKKKMDDHNCNIGLN